jgi:hypothetical protein
MNHYAINAFESEDGKTTIIQKVAMFAGGKDQYHGLTKVSAMQETMDNTGARVMQRVPATCDYVIEADTIDEAFERSEATCKAEIERVNTKKPIIQFPNGVK